MSNFEFSKEEQEFLLSSIKSLQREYASSGGNRDFHLEDLIKNVKSKLEPAPVPFTDPAVYEFLDNYAESMDWPITGWGAISRKLCEEYRYSPRNNHDFTFTAYGYFWAVYNDPFKANALVALLKIELDKVYEVIAKENKWV